MFSIWGDKQHGIGRHAGEAKSDDGILPPALNHWWAVKQDERHQKGEQATNQSGVKAAG
jgi:hypothetical protein